MYVEYDQRRRGEAVLYIYKVSNNKMVTVLTGVAHTLGEAKKLAETEQRKYGCVGTVTTVSKQGSTDMWFYVPSRRSGYMKWEKR